MTKNVVANTPVTGILRKEGGNASRSSSPAMRASGVHFQPPPNLGSLLEKYYSSGKSNISDFEDFITHMKNQKGASLIEWLSILQQNIASLKPDLERFIFEILRIPWILEEKQVVTAFRHFLANLATAHSFYVRHIMAMLVQNFRSLATTPEELESEVLGFNNLHETVLMMLEVAPLSAKTMLLKYCIEFQPYLLISQEHQHTTFLQNLTRVYGYIKTRDDRQKILKIIVARLVELDAHLPKLTDEMDSEDEDEEKVDAAKPNQTMIAKRNLDAGMDIMFKLIDEVSKGKAISEFYEDFMVVFESHILPTYATCHVQFLLFDLCRYRGRSKQLLARSFLDHMFGMVVNPNVASILRQSAVAYIASLLARARYISLEVTKQYLKKLVGWIHKYLDNCQDLKFYDYSFTDSKSHGPFYATCQAVFYLIAFKHQEFAEDRKNIAFLKALKLQSVVTCNLNPLRVCLPHVAKPFADVCKTFQVAYCDAIVKRNNRLNLPVMGSTTSGDVNAKPDILNTFFPFDPYTLPLTKKYVIDLFIEYQGNVDADSDSEAEATDEEHHDPEEVHEEDMSDDDGVPAAKRKRTISEKANAFLFGTSP